LFGCERHTEELQRDVLRLLRGAPQRGSPEGLPPGAPPRVPRKGSPGSAGRRPRGAPREGELAGSRRSQAALLSQELPQEVLADVQAAGS